MPSKKRKSCEQQQHSSEAYKKRLRRHKNHSPPPRLPDEEAKKFTFKTPCSQQFSLPESTVFYVAQNPISLWAHQNLIKTCKLLFRMSRILPVKDLSVIDNVNLSLKNEWAQERKALLNLKNHSLPVKFWIHHKFITPPCIRSNFVSTLSHSIYQCCVQRLVIHKQNFTFNELEFLTTGNKLQSVYFVKNVIKDSDGNATQFEKVFELLFCKNMKIELPLDQHGVGEDTATKMIETLEVAKFACVELRNIPESFDFQIFSSFLKVNMIARKHTFNLNFAASISLSYKTQLEQFINEIMQQYYTRGRSVPYIYFLGGNSDNRMRLTLLRYY